MPTDSRGRTYFRKLFFKKVTSSRETFPLAEGDIALDEDDGKLYRGDGSTVGGILIQSTAGISLTDISSATTAPSGGGSLVYNNTNGQITYTPPDLSGLGGGGLSNVVEDTTPQLGGDLDGQAFNITTTGKILYSNLYSTEGDLPNATTYHGMFAHVHATGAGYFAHGGAWIKLANDSQLSSYQTTAGLNSAIDSHLNQSGPTSGHVLSWNGSDYAWVANSGGGGGIALTDLSVGAEGSASGDGAIAYNNTTGVFTYTPPDLSGYLTSVPAQSFASLTGKPTTIAGYGITDALELGTSATTALAGNTSIPAAYTNSDVDAHLNQSNPTSGYVLSWNGADYAWVAQSGGGSQNLFSTVASSGQNNIVADGTTDTLYIEAGSGISITTDQNTDTLTISATGGGGGLSNIVEDTTPQLGGDLDTNGNKITFADSVNAEFGDSGDLKIFHNGGHSIVRETGTGSLYLQSDNNVILSTDSSTKVMVKGIANGATELYHNNVLKLNTSTSGDTIVDELHTEGATPHLTLKRTDNANVPTLRFKGSGGTIGASIDFDGTAGTSNELAFKTYDGASIAERFRVTYTGAKVTGNLNVTSGVHEKFATLTGSTGTVAHDCSTGHIFYHTGAAANFTANFTNLSLAQEDATNIAIIINQGNTGYIPSAVQIGGAAQTIVWNGNSTPSATDNGTDVFSFTILNDGGTYVVLGQMVSFGGV